MSTSSNKRASFHKPTRRSSKPYPGYQATPKVHDSYRGDGFDEIRQERAKAKRERRRLKRDE